MPTFVRDDVTFHYTLMGYGDKLPLLCLHGGGCDGRDFGALAEGVGSDRKVLCLDQRGHGQSDKPRGTYDPATLAADAAALLHELEMERVVVAGHSLGGAVAVQLLERSDIQIAGLISIDAPLVISEGMKQGMRLVQQAFEGSDGMAFYRQFMDAIVGYSSDPEGHAQRLETLCSIPEHVMASVVAHVITFDSRKLLAANQEMPLLHIDAGFDVCDLTALAEQRPDAWIGKVVGTGHYPHTETPAQVGSMVVHFLNHHHL